MPRNVKQTFYGANLDITEYPKLLSREKLMEKIEDDYKATQLIAGLHVPDKLFCTKDQFQILEHDLARMEDTKDRMYITAQGFVMQVFVIDDGKTKL